MKKYSIGLDIGTNSVGWAVVDENNQLVKKNGFTLWGVRMFDEAQDSSETRSHRSYRRRLERRKFRIKLLRELFNEEINKIDPTFFERMDDSFYKIEDKRNANFYNLFNDTYTDKDFFKKFPTIYHLRKYLCETNQKEDIRFVYLALHNMIKYRGNFLSRGELFNKKDTSRIKEILNEFNSVQIELDNESEENYSDYYASIIFDDKTLNSLETIMISKESKKEKRMKIKNLFKVSDKSLFNECVIPLLLGSKCNISNLYPVKFQKYEKCEIEINNEDLEIVLEESKTKISELNILFDFIINIKEIVDYYYLLKLLQSVNTLSEAMIMKYDEHNKDLKRFKEFVKKYVPNKYDECFKVYNEKLNNYVHYVGINSTKGIIERFSHCKRDDFYSYVQSILKLVNDESANEDIKYFTEKMENTDFLLRQNSDQNGSIPMQLNLMEINKIIDKQSKFYPFFNYTDSDDISVKDKIISIFKYVVPYYVGPLNTKSERSWIVRKYENIYPWNFDKVIDIDETSKKFIQNMQRKCTYLKGDDDYCLPKKSIVFSKYNCLTYLNKLSINGSIIPVDIKNEIYNNIFLKIKKPTKKDIVNYLITNYGQIDLTTTKLKDLPEINCDMSSYIKFNEIFEGKIEDKIDLIEQIIKDIIIFSDKKVLEKRLINVYKLDIDKVKKIKDLNYKDYSNLSNNLLNGLEIVNLETGEYMGTLLDVMYKTNYNLQEILYSPEYRLVDIIDKYNNENIKMSSLETVEEFLNENVALSPLMKRPLIQAHTIIQEVKKILKAPIDKYYVECTRTNKADKKQTESRYMKIKKLYDSCKKLAIEYDVDLNKLNGKLDKYKDSLKSDLLYLYFTQLGKCMYTLEDIDINILFSNNNKYDIDHIYPQALIKDDSITNKVLVKKEKNNEKQDNMLFEMSNNFLHKDAFKFYEKLESLNLITKEKYKRLTKKELANSELEVFVNRQLVSTNQAVKGLIQVLKNYDKVNPSDIVYSKAENISLARTIFNLPKSRLANNFHHAHDAYLNVVIGRVINEYFVKNHFKGSQDYYRMKTEKKTINVERILKYDKWYYGQNVVLKTDMINLLNKNLYERYDVSETIRTYNSNQLFSKITINPANKGTVPIKFDGPLSDISKYGGITSHSYCKYIIIEQVNKKGINEYILEPIPKAYEDKEELYLTNQGYINYKICHKNIKSNVVIEKGPIKFYITGKTGNQFLLKNAKDRYFKKYYIEIIKKLEKYTNNIKNEIYMPSFEDYIVISPSKNDKCKEIIISKDELINLYQEIKNKYMANVYDYSNIKNICENLSKVNLIDYTLKDLIKICTELLNLLQTNARKSADLKLIGLSSNSGILLHSKTISSSSKFISESITGYYKKVLFEVK